MPSAADIRSNSNWRPQRSKRELELKQCKEKLRWMQLELAAVEAGNEVDGLKSKRKTTKGGGGSQAEKEREGVKRNKEKKKKMPKWQTKRTKDNDEGRSTVRQQSSWSQAVRDVLHANERCGV